MHACTYYHNFCTHTYVEVSYIYIYIYTHIYIYIYMLRPPPHDPHEAAFLSSGSWEVGSLGCENIGRDQISPKFLKPEMRKHQQGSNFPKIPKI